MASAQHYIYLMIWLCFTIQGFNSDPCVNYAILPKLSTRHPDNRLPWDAKGLCDRYIDERWYRAEGSNMITKPPQFWSCGTVFPIWLAGSLPPNDGNEYESKACVKSFLGECSNKLPIKIKNCGSFYVYYLVSSRACPLAYCFTPNKAETNVQPDPCNHYTHLTRMQERLTTSLTRSSKRVCDMDLKEKWYRPSDSIMACTPRRLRCGTKYPVWLADLPPPQDNREHSLRVCMTVGDRLCANSWDIKVKNCGNFSVYSLKPTDKCPSAYCFVPQKRQDSSIQNKDPCSNYAKISKRKERTLSWKRKFIRRTEICDAYLKPGWYKYVKGDMVTTPPALGDCGTQFPIWLRGNLPLNDTQEHTLTACQVTQDGDCGSTLKVKVKNCGKFNVYFLSPTRSCPTAYCFGKRPKVVKKKGWKSKNRVDRFKNKTKKTDPCKNNVPLPDMKARAGKRSCNTLRANETALCDRYLEKRWYRVMGRNISTEPPKVYTCGTNMPIWLQDPLPQQDNIEHSLKACVVSFIGQCSRTTKIKVKNCGNYFVYYLVPTAACPAAYCFSSCPRGN